MATLRPAELLLAARVLAFAVTVPAITRFGLPRQASILEPRREPAADPEREAWLVENVDRVLARAAPLARPGCLTRGLTHYYFLRRAGADVDLAYGLGTPIGTTEGHCWLERAGEPFLEEADPRSLYVETYRIPRSRASAHARA
jgi:hypothetical protein